jgi:hypothetical protein
VVGGSNRSVEQSKAITNLVGTKQPNSWFVDICILSMSHNWKLELGVDAQVGGIIKYSDSESVLDLVLNGVWNIDYGGGIDEVILRTGIILLEGTESIVSSVEEVPIPKRTVSPEGTVSITGYDLVNAGLELTLSGVAVPTGLRVFVKPNVSDIVGYVDEKPIISRKYIQSHVIIEDNDKIILSGLWSNRSSHKLGSLLALGSSDSATEWIVCARFRKIK